MKMELEMPKFMDMEYFHDWLKGKLGTEEYEVLSCDSNKFIVHVIENSDLEQ